MNEILQSRETEKNKITAEFAGLETQEKAVQSELKRHKLGKWGKGLITRYADADDNSDKTREESERQAIKENRLAARKSSTILEEGEDDGELGEGQEDGGEDEGGFGALDDYEYANEFEDEMPGDVE